MKRHTISFFLSLVLCLSLLSACGTTTDVPTNDSDCDIAFGEAQQEELAEDSDSTTSKDGEPASDLKSGKDGSASDETQPPQQGESAHKNGPSSEAPDFSLSSILTTPQFAKFGKIQRIFKFFGGEDKYNEAVHELENELYEAG